MNERLRQALAKRKIGRAVQERILRLNPIYDPGMIPRGWHPTQTARGAVHMDVVARDQFDRRWGKGASRSLQAAGFIHAGGRRWWITRSAYEAGPSYMAGDRSARCGHAVYIEKIA